MSFQFKEVRQKIFILSFDNFYDLGMHFIRYQEYYESPNPIFKGNTFSLIEYMEWYSKSYGTGSFTYPAEWTGFNVPGWVMHDVFKKGIPDINKYDLFMKKIFTVMKKKYGKDFYLIGIKDGEENTYKHELAHAMWTIEPEYKKIMSSLVNELPKNIYNLVKNYLVENGYDKSVVDDEIHAYLCTGLNNDLKKIVKEKEVDIKDILKQFSKTLDDYLNTPV